MKNLTIGKRLGLGSAALCLLAGLLAWTGYLQIAALRAQVDGVPEILETRRALSEWQGLTSTNAGRTVAILRSADIALGDAMGADMKATSARISELQQHIEKLPLSNISKKLFSEVGTARSAYIAAR